LLVQNTSQERVIQKLIKNKNKRFFLFVDFATFLPFVVLNKKHFDEKNRLSYPFRI